MRRYSITYFIGQSIKGLWRNGVMSLASITVLMSCLVVMGSFTLLVLTINHNLDMIGILNKIVVFTEEGIDDLKIASIEQQIRTLDNINEIEYTSSEEAKAQQRERWNYPEFFDIIDAKGDNPFAATFTITYKDNSKVSTLQYELERIDGVDSVTCYTDIASSLDNAKNGIIVIFVWFLIILFVVSIFVIINTIKLAVYSRRQEINIMRYVGATNWFIVLPFIFEGILIGIVSSGLAYIVVLYAYRYIYNMVIVDFQIIQMIQFADIRLFMILAFVLIGVLTGIIGSCISLNKYMKA